jgi:hypothetical protein
VVRLWGSQSAINTTTRTLKTKYKEVSEMKQINKELTTSLGNINKLPTAMRVAGKMGVSVAVNYGCGLGGVKHAQILAGKMELINYEPFIEELSVKPAWNVEADAVVCSCVLNVIESQEIVESILDDLDRYHEAGKKIIITIYEGDRTGVARVMKGGTYQRHKKSVDYSEIEARGYVRKHGAWIKA